MGGNSVRTDGGLEVRLYAPRTDVVIVWVSGLVDPATVGQLVMRIDQQLARASRVIVDLSGVDDVVGDAVSALGRVVDGAVAGGVELHVAGVEHYALDCALRRAGFEHLHQGPAAAVLAAGDQAVGTTWSAGPAAPLGTVGGVPAARAVSVAESR